MDEKIAALANYNFWKGNVIETGFPRHDYTDKIMNYLNTRLVKVLVGQRRVGKSYILRQIASQLISIGIPAKNIFYINKEFIEFDFLTTYTELEETVNAYKASLEPKGKFYLFIDEIQMIKGWEHFVNSHSQDFSEPCEIFITGSNSEMLSGELATLLAGRYVKFEIFPFSYAEYLGITKKQKSRWSYAEYMETGALPELFVLPNEETRRNYISALKDTILLRDIIWHYTIKDAKLLEDVFIYLVNNASNLISITNILNYFGSRKRKTSYDTLSNYISYLEQSFLIHKVERFNIKGKEVLSGIYKYYMSDLCFKNYLYPEFDHGIGYKLENLLFLELKRKGYMVYVGTFRGKEIDFIARRGDEMIYIQCCYMLTDEKVIAREYGPLEAIKDNYDKYIVTMDEIRFPSKEGIKHIQAWNFSDVVN